MQTVDYYMHGGDSCVNGPIEAQYCNAARELFVNNARFGGKTMKWMYDFMKFSSEYYTHNSDQIKRIYSQRAYPYCIEVEITTACDLSCPICERTHWHEPNLMMSYEQFTGIIDQFPNLSWIGMAGIGQTFLNPRAEDMMRYVKRKGVYIELYDNFKHITPDRADRLLDLGIDKLLVSIDAATEETYKKTRPGANWATMIKHVKYLDRERRRRGLQWPELCLHFVVCKDNVHEMAAFVDFAADLGVNISYVQFSRMLHKFNDEVWCDIPSSSKDEVEAVASRRNMRIAWNADVPDKKPPFSQCTAWIQPFIFVDGTVTACCATHEANRREFERETSPGNIFKTPFREIWNGPKYKELIDGISGNTPRGACTMCPIYEANWGPC